MLSKRLAAIQAVQAVIAAYWDLVLAERQVAITRSSLELAKERLRITQIGAGTRTPVVHTVELLDWATGGPKPAALA